MRMLVARLAMAFATTIRSYLGHENGADRIVTEAGDSIIVE
jgi:hypothetical protein